MNSAKAPRIVALIASIAATFLIVQALADYGYPAPQAAPAIAQATTSTPR